MACPSGRSPATFITPDAHDPAGPRSSRARPPTPGPSDRPAPVLGPFRAIIDQILADDERRPAQAAAHRRAGLPPPPRRARLPRRLRPGATLSPREHRRRHRETFIPLGHLPGQRLEADFGHIHVDFPDGRRLVPFLVTTWAYSNAPFVLALPFERTEAILDGMVAAFEFFGAVPREVWWDNPKTVATLILQGRERQLHPRYAALASHYVFDPRFCMPARGNEKPDAEGDRQGRATPVRHARAPRRRPRRIEHIPSRAVRGRADADRAVALRPLRDRRRGSPRTSPRRRPLPGASVRPLRDPSRGRGGQVPDRRLRHQPLQRAAAVRVPDGDGQGLRRPGRDRGRGPGRSRRTRGARRGTRWCSTRSTTWRRWAASPAALDHAPVFRDWELPGVLRRVPRRTWKSSTARRPAPAGSCGSCNCWASTP